MNQLLSTDFFSTRHSISSIADYCKENFDSDFKTSELSGILLKLANENKLIRERSEENNRFRVRESVALSPEVRKKKEKSESCIFCKTSSFGLFPL